MDPIKFMIEFVTDKRLWLNLTVLMIPLFCAIGFYYSVAYFAQKRYFEWSMETGCSSRLPDIFLDLIDPSWENKRPPQGDMKVVAMITDIYAAVAPGAALTTLILHRQYDLLTWYGLYEVMMNILNAGAENWTVMPASFGDERCFDFIESKESDIMKESGVDYSWSLNLMGSCVAMMWSGHTTRAVSGFYFFWTSMEREYPIFRYRVGGDSRYSVSLKFLFVCFVAISMGVLLLVNLGHYTVDIYIAYLITPLFLSSDRLRYFSTRINPFLRDSDIEMKLHVQDSVKFDELILKLEKNHPEILKDLMNENTAVIPEEPEKSREQLKQSMSTTAPLSNQEITSTQEMVGAPQSNEGDIPENSIQLAEAIQDQQVDVNDTSA